MPQNHQNTKTHKKKFEPLPKELESIGKKIVDAAYTVHKTLGPGLLEKVYVPIYRDCHELTKRGLKYLRQIDIPINFNVVNIGQGIKRFVLYRFSGISCISACLPSGRF